MRRAPPRIDRLRPNPGIALACASLCALAALCVACPGSLDDPGRFSWDGGGCADAPTAIFAVTCTDSQCHTTMYKAQGLDLQSPDVAARLVGVAATGGAGLLVDPMSPAQSVLYTKLSFSPPFGSQMPLGKTPLDDATVACVLAWITANVPSVDGAAPSGDEGSVDTDSGTPVGSPDAGPGVDAGAPDASRPDARATEAGSPDAAARDAAPRDATPREAAPPDAGAANDAVAGAGD
jgi:hypothetical protein